jgi:hypothetical protein
VITSWCVVDLFIFTCRCLSHLNYVFDTSVIDCGIEPLAGLTKDYKITISSCGIEPLAGLTKGYKITISSFFTKHDIIVKRKSIICIYYKTLFYADYKTLFYADYKIIQLQTTNDVYFLTLV